MLAQEARSSQRVGRNNRIMKRVMTEMLRRGPIALLSAAVPASTASMDRTALDAILDNITAARELFEAGAPPALLGTVCGSKTAQRFWQHQLERMQPEWRTQRVVSLHEDLPVNQALGLLLMWQRIRDQVRPEAGALLAFVFGEGSRATPLTECEGGQKPAMRSFVVEGHGSERRALSIVELALRTFAPVEAYLRRSGFDGVVVKWGDEIQIPTLSLRGAEARFEHADVVRFVSMTAMSEDLAANKDWVGVDDQGRVTAFIPRRPLDEMSDLADRGLLQRRDGTLYGGINLGSIGLSRAFLDALLSEFAEEVNDPHADRKRRPDLDPQLFTALTIAALPDPAERERAWTLSVNESGAMATLDRNMPGILARLRGVLERFETTHGRPLKMVAMDFQEQFWGDIGQHRAMFELYAALLAETAEGRITRALAGVDEAADADGNRFAGACSLGPGVTVRGSVLIDAQVGAGHIQDSVLIGTRCGRIEARSAFDVQSTVGTLHLPPRAGSYRVVDPGTVALAPGERLTTVVLANEAHHLRVNEEDNLRDREHCYERPIRGNAISFAEAHRLALASDLETCNRRRSELEASARDAIDSLDE